MRVATGVLGQKQLTYADIETVDVLAILLGSRRCGSFLKRNRIAAFRERQVTPFRHTAAGVQVLEVGGRGVAIGPTRQGRAKMTFKSRGAAGLSA